MTREIDSVVEDVVAEVLAADLRYSSAKELCRLALREAARDGLPAVTEREREKLRRLVRELLGAARPRAASPYDGRIAEANAEIDELEGAIWELGLVPGTEAARRTLQAELDWFHEEPHQLAAARDEGAKGPPSS